MDSSSSPIQCSTSPSSQSPSALLPMQPSTSPSPPPPLPPPPQPPASVSPSPPPPQPPSQSSPQQQVDNSSTTTAENIVKVVPLNMKQYRELERAVKLNQTVKSTCSREVYEAFHERLKAFRHDQADSKEVIQDICRLFADRPALLKGFKYFVPEWYLQPDDYVPLEEEEDYDGDEDDDDEEEEDHDKDEDDNGGSGGAQDRSEGDNKNDNSGPSMDVDGGGDGSGNLGNLAAGSASANCAGNSTATDAVPHVEKKNVIGEDDVDKNGLSAEDRELDAICYAALTNTDDIDFDKLCAEI